MKPVKPHLHTDPSRLLVLLAKLLNCGNMHMKSHEEAQGNSQYTSRLKKVNAFPAGLPFYIYIYKAIKRKNK